MNVTTNAILVAMVMISVTKRVGVFTPRPGKNARQNFSFKGAQIFLYWYNDHKTVFAHNRGDMHCIKSHIHFQVSPSTSEIFNKNLKIGRFYPGLPYLFIYLFIFSQKKKGNSGNSTWAISSTRTGDVRQRIFFFFWPKQPEANCLKN